MSNSKNVSGSTDDFEATHSLEDLKRMAREQGVSPSGSKGNIAVRLLQKGAAVPMIDQYDIKVLQRWLYLAQRYGTDAIKIVAGDAFGEYKVTVDDPESPLRIRT